VPTVIDRAPCHSIVELLAESARLWPDREALAAPGRTSLSYRELLAQVTDLADHLRGCGLAAGDRVAIVLPNGPEMAVAFLATAAVAASAPLNPAYRAAEFEFFLSDLDVAAVIALEGASSAVRDVALRQGIPEITLTPLPGGAGRCRLSRAAVRPTARRLGSASPAALVLHTSGTTSRPKMVPLTPGNLCASAHNIGATLALTPADRCLNVMPLFHIHGLMAAVLATLAHGGAVICTPGFLAPRFFEWMEACAPTWYTAVPTIHQSVVERAAEPGHAAIIRRRPLRFIRSSSAALPPPLMAALERTFGAPVIESYGMTEASHQMASNPLPPAVRKPGSVGPAAGPAIAIMAEDGSLVGPGVTGEVVIRGATVMQAYEGDAGVNGGAFVNGWFRTGDQGRLDDDGYLFLTGRLKELINRAGEKIAPREVDEVLLAHPAVSEAVAFGVPDRVLGESVAAAVVLRAGYSIDGGALRLFASARLADFKVPTRVLILDALPKGPTGKVQRVGLAERLGILESPPAAPTEYLAPRTVIEQRLAGIWGEVLSRERVGVHDPFVALGGDSMLAAQLLERVRTAFGAELSLVEFFAAPTVAEQAEAIEQALRTDASVWALLDEAALFGGNERDDGSR
jgi:acyl-CoA synthetase (AMP-forming)/AMP-acid ligase II/aryl carrier-like protein